MNARHILTSLAFVSLFALSACDKDDDANSNAPGDACASICSTSMTCDPEFSYEYESQDECVMDCNAQMAAIEAESPSCAAAIEALNLCTGALNCDEYQDYWNEPTPDYPCADEDDNALEACYEF
jgi:hypothetical protein